MNMFDVVVPLIKLWLTSDMKWYNKNAHSIPNEEKAHSERAKKISQSQYRRQNCVFTLIQLFLIHLMRYARLSPQLLLYYFDLDMEKINVWKNV